MQSIGVAASSEPAMASAALGRLTSRAFPECHYELRVRALPSVRTPGQACVYRRGLHHTPVSPNPTELRHDF